MNECIECGMKNLCWIYKNKCYDVMNLISNYLFLLCIISSKIILKALKLAKILIILNVMFIYNLFQNFNLISLFYYMVSVFASNWLNGINVIILFLDSDEVLGVNVNI